MGALAFVGTPTMEVSNIKASQDVEAYVAFTTSLAIPADGKILVVFPANFALTNFAGSLRQIPHALRRPYCDPTTPAVPL